MEDKVREAAQQVAEDAQEILKATAFVFEILKHAGKLDLSATSLMHVTSMLLAATDEFTLYSIGSCVDEANKLLKSDQSMQGLALALRNAGYELHEECPHCGVRHGPDEEGPSEAGDRKAN